MKRVWKTMLQTSKTHSAPLFASALFAVAAAVTPTTVCAQAGHAANHQASTSAAATAIPQSSQNELAKLDALPPAGRSYISATLGGDMPGYHVEARGAGFHAAARGLDSDFTAQGVEISADSAHIRLALVAYGHGDGLNQAGSASANRVSPNRVEYRRGHYGMVRERPAWPGAGFHGGTAGEKQPWVVDRRSDNRREHDGERHRRWQERDPVERRQARVRVFRTGRQRRRRQGTSHPAGGGGQPSADQKSTMIRPVFR